MRIRLITRQLFAQLLLGAGIFTASHSFAWANDQVSVLLRPAPVSGDDSIAQVNPTADVSPASENISRDVASQKNAASQTDQTAAAASAPATQSELDALSEKLRRVLDLYYACKEHVDRRTPWEVMHWAIAFGTDSFMYGGPKQSQVSAIGWLGWNGRCKGQGLLYVDAQGRLGVQRGVGVQGHDGQLLAIYAQSRVRTDYPLRVDGKEYTVADLIEFEKRKCEPGTELTFKLIGFAHYLPFDAEWEDEQKRTWNIEKVVREELAQPVIGAACGGTHRMTGFSYAVRKAQAAAAGKPLTGDFARAEKFVNDYHRYAWSLQNDDGSFSTDYFRNRAASSDIAKRLETTGHMLEWLAYSLPTEELKQNRTVKAANYLADILLAEPSRDWHMGALGHGLHAVAIYESRAFAQWKPSRADEVAAAK
jgi:hypothetical protein